MNIENMNKLINFINSIDNENGPIRFDWRYLNMLEIKREEGLLIGSISGWANYLFNYEDKDITIEKLLNSPIEKAFLFPAREEVQLNCIYYEQENKDVIKWLELDEVEYGLLFDRPLMFISYFNDLEEYGYEFSVPFKREGIITNSINASFVKNILQNPQLAANILRDFVKIYSKG